MSAFQRADQRWRLSSRRTTAGSVTQLSCTIRRSPICGRCPWNDRALRRNASIVPASGATSTRIIVDVVGTAQQPQTALGALPGGVQIEQQCDDLGFRNRCGCGRPCRRSGRAPSPSSGGRRGRGRIFPRPRGAAPARSTRPRDGKRPVRMPGFRPGNCRARGPGENRRRAGPSSSRVHKILDNDKVERVAAQRRRPQAIKIEQRQVGSGNRRHRTEI